MATLCLIIAGAIILAAAYAGWTSGVEVARAAATDTAMAEVLRQCELLPQDLAKNSFDLARRRIEDLQQALPAPDCLRDLVPAATAAYLTAQPTPMPMATQTATPSATATATVTAVPFEPAPTLESSEPEWTYDLDALLAEAQAEHEQRHYTAAIDTLEAIVSIDDDFKRDHVRRLLLDALTAEALALFRSFKLSEAIVLTERAEVFGDIGELSYERFIAETFIIGQTNKTTNPAEAVRRFSEIVYQHNPNYMNGQVVGELQDALRYYADALAFQGDACQALEHYAAALQLQPTYTLVSRGELASKQQQTAQSCSALPADASNDFGATPAGSPQPIGVRATPQVGQSG